MAGICVSPAFFFGLSGEQKQFPARSSLDGALRFARGSVHSDSLQLWSICIVCSRNRHCAHRGGHEEQQHYKGPTVSCAPSRDCVWYSVRSCEPHFLLDNLWRQCNSRPSADDRLLNER